MNQILTPVSARPATCIASARISTRKQMSGESLNDQARALEHFAETKGWRILPDGHAQQEIGTATKRRRIYEQHIQYIKDHPGAVGYYVIRYIDRFTREGNEQYQRQKRELAQLGVALVDTSGVIQESRNMQEMDELGFSYDWSVESPSDLTEVMLSTTARQERNTILKRIIPRQIMYTQKGYQIGRPDDGYVNERISIGAQKRYIQSPDPERAHFIRAMFELRAAAKLTDRQLVAHLNDELGFRSPTYNRWNTEKTEIIGQFGGNPLNEKQLLRIIQRTSYAGVICRKWTHYKPVRAQWDGLVPLELWNQANRGRRYLETQPDGGIRLLYDYSPKKPVIKRLRHNPDYPFKCIRCPECGKSLKGSAPKGKTKYYPRYHCARGHRTFTISRDNMHAAIRAYLSGLDYSEAYFDVLREVLQRKLNERKAQAEAEAKRQIDRVGLLKAKQTETLAAFISANGDTTKALLERQLHEMETEIQASETNEHLVGFNEADFEKVVAYARHMMDKPETTLIDEENPLRQIRLFELLFEEIPTYADLISGTPKIRPIFNLKVEKHLLITGASPLIVNPLTPGWNPFEQEMEKWLSNAEQFLRARPSEHSQPEEE